MKLKSIVILALAATFCSFGCGEKGLDGLVPCQGQLVFDDGTPIAGAKILFSPTAATGQRAAAATSDANGVFVATTLNPNDGVYPGSYKVTVVKYVFEGGSPTVESTSEELGEDDPKVVAQTNELPAKYESSATSGLEVDVPSGGVSDYKITLTK